MKNITYGLLACVVVVILVSFAANLGIFKDQHRWFALVAKSVLTNTNSRTQTQNQVQVPPVTNHQENQRPVFQFAQTLQLNDDNINVLALQLFLNNEGFFVTENETTYFGNLTARALTRYQESHGLSPTGNLNQETLDSINNQIQILTSPGPSDGICSNYPVSSTDFPANFPSSSSTPPWLPVDRSPYVPETYDCDNFAMVFCERMKLIDPSVDCSILLFDSHAINIIQYRDSNGVEWVCVVEPQSNKFYCIKKSEWNDLPDGWREWVKNVMCRDYYGYSRWKCEEGFYPTKYRYLGRCSMDLAGTPCGPGQFNEFIYCTNPTYEPLPGENPGYIGFSCDCEIIEGEIINCKWKHKRLFFDKRPLFTPQPTPTPTTPKNPPQTTVPIESNSPTPTPSKDQSVESN